MSIKVNGTEIPVSGTIKANNTNITKVVANDVVVWGASTPYTITDFTKYNWTYSTQSGDDNDYQILQNELRLYAKKSPNVGHAAQTRLTATLPTGGCNKMKVEYYAYDGYSAYQAVTDKFHIYNTTSVAQAERRTIVFDISGDNINFYIHATDGTAYFTAELKIYSIEFYNE